MGIEDKDFDVNNPPDLCEYCPDLSDKFFDTFSSEWLGRLGCAYCGLPLIHNKTILKIIESVIRDIEKKNKT